jgi:hypothetical protein
LQELKINEEDGGSFALFNLKGHVCLTAFGSRGGSIRETRIVLESIQTATWRTQYEYILKGDNIVIHKTGV